jgi:DNA-binding NtrC family response regulator
MVTSGQFREDLFYRLNVLPVTLPPLRERAGDVERIARHLCARLCEANGRAGMEFSDAALDLLAKQPWPGNVRQLSNIVERLVVLADVDVIGSVEVERELGRRPLGAAPLPRPEEEEGGSLPWRRREAEKGAILHALARAGENRTLAARLLDVSRSTFYKKLREHGLD